MRIIKINKVTSLLIGITMMAILLCSGTKVQALQGLQVRQDGDYSYVVESNAIITKYNGVGGDVKIPSTLGGFPVTRIDYFDELADIGYSAFSGCKGLTSINIPQGVTSIDYDAFRGCTGLTSITVDADNRHFKSVDGVLYDKSGTSLIMFPEGLTSINIPQGVMNIGYNVFSGCKGLTNISVAVENLNYSSNDGVLYDKSGTSLKMCPEGLTSINIPQGVTSIGDYAFSNCTGLTSINIPQGVTSIGFQAFSGCTGLTSINIPQGVTGINIQGGTSIDYSTFSGCTSLTSITVDADNLHFKSVDGVLYDKSGTSLMMCPEGLTSINIPQGVTSIANQAFSGCKGLTSIIFNSAETIIPDNSYMIPSTTKIVGYDPSTAKVYANKNNRVFEVIGSRLAGYDRFQTARVISEQFNSGTVQDVIITSGNNFPDALSASVLAKKLSAPILLVDSKTEGSSEAFAYISQHLNQLGTVHIIGGTGVIGTEFEGQLTQMGYHNIDRIGGYDRYDTSVVIAQKLNVAKNTPVVIASGEDFHDALSISSIASSKGWPIILAGKNFLTQGVIDYLSNEQPSQVYIVGGTFAVSDNAKSQIQSLVPNATVTRLAGYDVFDTNASIVQTFAPNPKNIYFATSSGFADALAGSVLASMTGDPIVLVDQHSNNLPPKIVKYLSYLNDMKNATRIVSFGGSAVVPDSQMESANSILNVAP